MKRLRILCSKKLTSGPSAGTISHIGGVNGHGDKWTISVDEAIKGINTGSYEFFIVEKFKEIDVEMTGEFEKNLIAHSHREHHNHLLDLPDCP